VTAGTGEAGRHKVAFGGDNTSEDLPLWNHDFVEKRNRLNAQFERLLAVLPRASDRVAGRDKKPEPEKRRLQRARRNCCRIWRL
jgi:hypothetical protein